MSGSKLGTPKSQDGWVDGVRCMLAARSGAVKARTSAINTARSLLTTAPEGLRSRFRGMAGPRLMEELPSVRAEGARHHRDLPWRYLDDPYAVLVSEIMLQQTQVARVGRYWDRFLAAYGLSGETGPRPGGAG